jgi:hypothetical protein
VNIIVPPYEPEPLVDRAYAVEVFEEGLVRALRASNPALASLYAGAVAGLTQRAALFSSADLAAWKSLDEPLDLSEITKETPL